LRPRPTASSSALLFCFRRRIGGIPQALLMKSVALPDSPPPPLLPLGLAPVRFASPVFPSFLISPDSEFLEDIEGLFRSLQTLSRLLVSANHFGPLTRECSCDMITRPLVLIPSVITAMLRNSARFALRNSIRRPASGT